jgi:hypothetical protein
MERKGFQLDSFWTRHSAGLAVAVVVLVSGVGYLLDRLLVLQGVPRGYMLVATNTITGIIAGGLFFQAAKHEKQQRAMIREKMQTVAELNHHIRNALQVIKLCGAHSDSMVDARQLQLVKESADRIEWALREILPKYPANQTAVPRHPPVGYAAVSSPIQELGAFAERRHAPRLH